MVLRNFQWADEQTDKRRLLRWMDPLMKRLFLLPLILAISLLISACAPGKGSSPLSGLPFMVTLTPEAPRLAKATQPAMPDAATARAVVSEAPSETVAPASSTPNPPDPTATLLLSTPYFATPTETLLPQLELPTERPRAPALLTWTGQPSYPGDTDPGLLFLMDYNPDVWAQTEGLFGDIVLGNRQIEYCTITPWTGRGLPVAWKVTHEFRALGSGPTPPTFDVNTVTFNDVVKFVSYVGGDGKVLTGFQVSFNEQQDRCLQDAEAVFGTLRSFAAIPTSSPSP
jgi:hypothetical protein